MTLSLSPFPTYRYLNGTTRLIRSNLEETLSISKRVEVAGSVLLVHGLSSELLCDHVAHDAHHSSTAVVELNIELAGLLLGVEDVAAEIANAVITVVLGGREPCKLNESEESDDLGKTGGGDGENTVDASGDVGELKVVGGGDVSIENNVVVVDNGADDSSHCNTAVLALDRTTALEGLGLRVKPSKRIKNTKRLSYTKLLSMDRVHGDTFPERAEKTKERKG